jgi:N-acetylmuramoyl-L-alanine amidase
LLKRLIAAYKRANIEHPNLRAVTLAQWMLESGRATSELATRHLNFGGLKFRAEMAPFATKISFEAHDGVDDYCKFATVEDFINGYWAFIAREPYRGWEGHAASGESFIRFIGRKYTPTPGYADKVLRLVSEADALLGDQRTRPPAESSSGDGVNLGTIVIDPGHGGTRKENGSSPNNATSKSGVLEKTLTLDFAQRLKSELISQANEAGESIKVVLTRSTDVNLPADKRAGTAFDLKAKLFLSIHFNGLDRESVRGTETFYCAAENGNLNLADDKAFAQDVQDAVFNALRALDPAAANRGIKPDTASGPKRIAVLNDQNLKNQRRSDRCRAALVEIEFISNPGADRLLVSGPKAEANRTEVMAVLARALRKQLRGMATGLDLVA